VIVDILKNKRRIAFLMKLKISTFVTLLIVIIAFFLEKRKMEFPFTFNN